MKKSLTAFLLLFALTFGLLSPARAETLDPDSFIAKSIVLMDALTGEILFEKDADARRYPASTTKILTLLIAINESSPDEMVTIPVSASQIPLDSSRVPVYPGEVMPMIDLWYGLMFRSGNDAANAIAEAVSGSIPAFVDEMNEWAEKLGMKNTHFANAHGYTNANHYTTARDMANLAFFALNNDLFREISFDLEYVMQPTTLRGELKIKHDYAILDYKSMYYYQYARGIKTGYTAQAGQCFVGAAVKDGRELLAVILNCGGLKPNKWQEAARLFEYGFNVLESR